MKHRRTRFILLFILVLLQCFAPLLHAHTFGQGHEGGFAHLHEVDGLHAGEHGGDHSSLEQAHATDSPSIGIAQEYRQDNILELNDAEAFALLSAFHFPALFERQLFVASTAAPPGENRTYLSPFPQAPPTILV